MHFKHRHRKKKIRKFKGAGFENESADVNYPQGNNYCLLIAINNYNNLTPLNNTIRDVVDFEKVIRKKFSDHSPELENQGSATNAGAIPEGWTKHYESRWVTKALLDEHANKNNIIKELTRIRDQITINDNLIIFFSGHGYKPKRKDADDFETYFCPVEADTKTSPVNTCLSWSELTNTFFSKIGNKCFHFLLIVDVCYGGALQNLVPRRRGDSRPLSLPKGKVYALPSNWLIASGRSEPVEDGTPGEHSPFAHILIQHLEDTKDTEITITNIEYHLQANLRHYEQPLNPVVIPFGKNNKGGEFVFRKSGAGNFKEIELKLKDAFYKIDFKRQKYDFRTGLILQKYQLGMVLLNGYQEDGLEILSRALLSEHEKELFPFTTSYRKLRNEVGGGADEIWEALQKICLRPGQVKVCLTKKETTERILSKLSDKPIIVFLEIEGENEEGSYSIPIRMALTIMDTFLRSLQKELNNIQINPIDFKNHLFFFVLNKSGKTPEQSPEVSLCKFLPLPPLKKLDNWSLDQWWHDCKWHLVEKRYPQFKQMRFDEFTERDCRIGNAARKICIDLDFYHFYEKLIDLERFIF